MQQDSNPCDGHHDITYVDSPGLILAHFWPFVALHTHHNGPELDLKLPALTQFWLIHHPTVACSMKATVVQNSGLCCKNRSNFGSFLPHYDISLWLSRDVKMGENHGFQLPLIGLILAHSFLVHIVACCLSAKQSQTKLHNNHVISTSHNQW